MTDLREKREAIEQNVAAIIDAYKTAVCLEVCTAMHVKLPRELRDAIYALLMRGRVGINSMSTGVTLARAAIVAPSTRYAPGSIPSVDSTPYFAAKPRTAEDPLCSEIFWREEATGPVLGAELMASFYRENDFVFQWYLSMKDSAFGRVDRFGAGLEPSTLVTKVTIEIDVQDFIEDAIEEEDSMERQCALIDTWFPALISFGAQVRVRMRFLHASKSVGGFEDDFKFVLLMVRDVAFSLMKEGRALRASVEHVETALEQTRRFSESMLREWLKNCKQGASTDEEQAMLEDLRQRFRHGWR